MIVTCFHCDKPFEFVPWPGDLYRNSADLVGREYCSMGCLNAALAADEPEEQPEQEAVFSKCEHCGVAFEGEGEDCGACPQSEEWHQEQEVNDRAYQDRRDSDREFATYQRSPL